jgi:hypothetical protein
VRLRRVALTAVLLLAHAAAARAQGPGPGTVEISGGGMLAGGYDLGRRSAQLTSNTGTTGGTFDLFSVEGRVKPAFGVVGRIGVYVTPAFAVEGGVQWLRPVNAQRITGDTEGAPDITAEETIDQYVFDGSALFHFGRGAVAPFVYGGAGYLRQLHEGDTLLEDGLEIHAGVGIKWWLGTRVGIRGEAGLSVRDGSADEDNKRRSVPTAAGSVIWVF